MRAAGRRNGGASGLMRARSGAPEAGGTPAPALRRAQAAGAGPGSARAHSEANSSSVTCAPQVTAEPSTTCCTA